MKTLRLITLILILSNLAACGHKYSVDPELAPYVRAFFQAGNISSTIPVYIHFGDLSDTSQFEAGLCTTGFGQVEITIDAKYWNLFNDTEKTLVMFHECGHCYLGRVHNSVVDSQGYPVSIMNPDISPVAAHYVGNEQAYLNELFSTIHN